MKKTLFAISAFLMLTFGASADEGMWLPPLLQKMNGKAMANIGCRLTPEQIYDINHSSLKDAIVQFGGGCTGEMISDKGLLVTNHHCGYGSIQKLSTPEHNYLEDGFWAMKNTEELPVPGLTVRFLQSMTDVTAILEKSRTAALKEYKDSANAEELAMKAYMAAREQLISTTEAANPNCQVRIINYYNDNVSYLIIDKVYRDVRFVGAPPASMGKFGGETDNWMWPRHTCDFSMFRVYANKDNEPADYSEDNVPMTPKQSLKISLKGVSEGDYAMVMGYPGRTQRFQTASMLEQMIRKQDVSIAARTLRQSIMKEGMEADPAVRLQYANKYAGSSNGWKKWIGEKKAFEKLNIIGREEQKEADFMKWVNANKKRKAAYGSALTDIKSVIDETSADELAFRLILEAPLNIGMCNLIGDYAQALMLTFRAHPEDTAAAFVAAKEAMKGAFKDYYEPLERKLTAGLLKFYRENARPSDFPEIEGHDFATMDIDAYVSDLYDHSIFASDEKMQNSDIKSFKEFRSEPALVLYNAIIEKYSPLYKSMKAANVRLAAGSKAFAAGLLEWEKGKPSYPDANSTMRLTYGTVKGYSPADGVVYKYYTTLAGVMEKEDPDNYEFRVPAKVKALYEAHDFGQYANAEGKVPTCFLTNCDITGGNSGSPVLDAEGRLIGLAFDGNWESMSSDVMFEPDLQRCICVDIHYVLFMVDKFGGAGYLLNEMNIEK